MYNRHDFLKCMFISIVALSTVPLNAQDKHQKPHIILFVSDDHGWADSGAYGDSNVFNLSPDTLFTTHITGCKSGPHYLPHWDSWVEKARTNAQAQRLVHSYQHRPQEELYDLVHDPYEMNNLAQQPDQAGLLKSLRAQLGEWCQAQGDTVGWQHLSGKGI